MRWWWLVLPASALLLVWVFRGNPPSDEEQIAKVLEEMRQSAEARQPTGILQHVDESFRSDSGLGRRELHGLLVAQFLGAHEVGVTVVRKQISVTGEAATAELSLLLSRDGQRDMRQLLLRFTKIKSGWKVSGAQHDPVPVPS